MCKYIKATDAMDLIQRLTDMPYSDLVDPLAAVPAANVVPVVRGRWIRHEHDDETFANYECSICTAYPTGGIRSNYCPNCGAKMNGEVEDLPHE